MGTSPIRVGLAGLGRVGLQAHIPELGARPEEFALVAACDHDPARLAALPDKLAKVRRHATFDSLLADADVELVDIATRHPDHVPMALAALDAGKYVMVEKPVALTIRAMAKLAAAARAHPGRVFWRLNRRFEAPFVKARALAAAGGPLGDIHTIKIQRGAPYCRRNDWMTMTDFGGGLLTNWGPHIIDHALQWLESPVAELWADVRRVVSIGDGDDHGKIVLRGENGRVVDVEISGAHALPSRELEVIGSRGALAYPVDGRIKMRHVDPAVASKPLRPHPENPPMEYGNFDETLTFVESLVEVPPIPSHALWGYVHASIRDGAPYPVRLEDVEEGVRIIETALRQSGFTPALAFLDRG